MNLPGLDLPTLSFAAPLDAETQTDFLTVDLDHLITSRLLIQGSSGAGKGWAIRTLLEQTHGRVQQLVLDKEGEFSTLREQYDYILAGAEGDVPATPRTAKLLCRQLMDLGASAVLDLYDLSLPDRQKFVRLFLEELMSLPKEMWRPLLVVIDEAHFFAPEGASTEASSAVISLCAEGRKRGYSAVLATQRLSKLSKDAAAELRNKMIGLTSLDVDVRRAADDLGFSREQATRLKELSPGEFFCVGPAIAKKVVLAKTGAVQTTHPRAGQIAAYTPPPPASAVQALLEQLKGLAEEAEAEVQAEQEKADRTAALERRVESLQKKLEEKQLAEVPGTAPATPEQVVEKVVEKIFEVEKIVEVERIVEVEKIVEVPVFREGELQRLSAVADDMASLGKDLLNGSREIRARLALAQLGAESLREIPLESTLGFPLGSENVGTSEGDAQTDMDKGGPDALTTQRAGEMPNSDKPLNPLLSHSQQVILNTLADLTQLGMTRPLRDHVALFAGVSPNSSGYGIKLKELREMGLIDYPGPSQLLLTEAGLEDARPSARPLTRKVLQEAWLSRLKAPQANLLKHLIFCYPSAMTREALAGYAGISASSSGYGIHLKALRDLGLVDYPGPGQVAATALLVPKGLPE